jgi:hypothetical protein
LIHESKDIKVVRECQTQNLVRMLNLKKRAARKDIRTEVKLKNSQEVRVFPVE